MKRTMRCLIALCLVLLNHFVFAGTTGKIKGKVTDANTGEPLIGANVMIRGTMLGATTDVEGIYFILNIQPGTYSVEASVLGYGKKVTSNVRVEIDLTTTVNFQLSQQTIEAGEVVVVAERTFRKDMTASEARISSDAIGEMPVVEMKDLLNLQTGVTLDAGGDIHIRGGRSSEVAYWVDGVPLTDVYDGRQSVRVENLAIQELQVISGTFNAEYGNAMSGIVNIVTKEGETKFGGAVSAYGGDYLSMDKGLFKGIDRINPLSENNLQLNLFGPVPFSSKRITFYSTARYTYSDGWLYGKSHFNIYGDTLKKVDYVPMNWEKKISTQTKLSYRPYRSIKIDLGLMTGDEKYEDYAQDLQYVPAGNTERNTAGRNYSLSLEHILSKRTFYSLTFSSFYKKYWSWLFKDENDPRYVNPNYWELMQRVTPMYTFTDHYIDLNRFDRRTNTKIAKFDLTSQISAAHLIKIGLESKFHDLKMDQFTIVDDPSIRDTVFTPYIPKLQSEGLKYGEFGRLFYHETPKEFSAYIQDKIEFSNVIVNLGLRWDYFDPNTLVPANKNEPYIDNPRDPALDSLSLAEREKIWWKNAKPKMQISPRFGISYPITDKGVIHFSFGHFFQIPQFSLLYANPGYKIPQTSGTFGVFRNPDMNAQKTVMYEIGIKQEVMQTSFDITGFYRDVRDWVSTGVAVDLGGGASYLTYANKDYSNVRGVVFSVTKQYLQYYSFNLNYTYQIAEGSNSDPNDAFRAEQSNSEPRRYIIPLDWDQTQTINGNFTCRTSWGGGSLIGRYGSGYPYTPFVTVASRIGKNITSQLETNSRKKPSTYELDLKLFKNVKMGPWNLTIYVDVYNLLDTRNEIIVYPTTGRANKDLNEPSDAEKATMYNSATRLNSIHDYFVHPEWYSAPRKVLVGFNLYW